MYRYFTAIITTLNIYSIKKSDQLLKKNIVAAIQLQYEFFYATDEKFIHLNTVIKVEDGFGIPKKLLLAPFKILAYVLNRNIYLFIYLLNLFIEQKYLGGYIVIVCVSRETDLDEGGMGEIVLPGRNSVRFLLFVLLCERHD